MRKGWLLSCVAAGLCMLAVGSTAFAESGKSNRAKSHHDRTIYGSSRSSGSSSEGTESTEGGSERSAGNANQVGPPPGGGPGGPGGPGSGGPGGPAVHATTVVLNKAGTAYITVTTDTGTVRSVAATAGTLTITEGTKSVTYKTVTLTIPSDAKVILDGKSSSLEKLTEGDRVSVSSSSEGTVVQAGDSSFDPKHIGRQGGPPIGGQPPISE